MFTSNVSLSGPILNLLRSTLGSYCILQLAWYLKRHRRSKGLTELELSGLGYSDAIVYRPAVLAGTNRAETRMVETVFTCAFPHYCVLHYLTSVQLYHRRSLAFHLCRGDQSTPVLENTSKLELTAPHRSRFWARA